jgi:LAO/AO transport system kinase
MPEENQTSISPDKKRELEAQLHKASKENRILCTSALAIAKSLNIPSSEVGKAANILKIKISKCQLGCF